MSNTKLTLRDIDDLIEILDWSIKMLKTLKQDALLNEKEKIFKFRIETLLRKLVDMGNEVAAKEEK